MTWDPKKSALCRFITELQDVHRFGLHTGFDPCTRAYTDPPPETLDALAAENHGPHGHMFRLVQEAVYYARLAFEREGHTPDMWPRTAKVEKASDAGDFAWRLRRNLDAHPSSPGLAATVEALEIAARATTDDAPGDCAALAAKALKACAASLPAYAGGDLLRAAGALVKELSGETAVTGDGSNC